MLRRRFIELGGLAAVSALTARRPRPLSAFAPRAIERVGLQLYTIRSLMSESVERTLELVAEIGYREVEFAGYFDRSPAEIRELLYGLGLDAPSAHVPLAPLRQDLDAVLETAAAVGHRSIVLPWIAADQRSLNGFPHLLLCQCFPDLLLDRCEPGLVDIEIDLFWIRKGGQDPLAYFEAHPGRFTQCHVKDMSATGEMVDVGSGVIDFRAIFAQAERAGIEHYYVEHDAPDDPTKSLRRSYRHLAEL